MLISKHIGKLSQLIKFSQRSFPRTIYKEQQFQKESKYRFRDIHPEKDMEIKNAKTRKELEQLKEGERSFAKFQQETSAQDQEQEKELDRFIDEKIEQGYEDSKIIDEVLTGGQQSLTNKDVDELELEKEKELFKELKKAGIKPVSLANTTMEDGDEFENFQQKAGKMMYEEDQILMEKWIKEEREKRLKERGQVFESTKQKRSIEPPASFGHVKETVDVKDLHKNTMEGTEYEDDYSLDSHLEALDEDKNFNKAMDKNLKAKEATKRLRKEVERQSALTDKDKDFLRLIDNEEKENELEKGEAAIKEDKSIVGKQPRNQKDTEVLPEPGKPLTTEQKIQKELKYVAESLALDPRGKKHWYYKLKREYEEQEKLEKQMEQKQAKKDFRKMMKQYSLPKVLQEEEDYEKFYEAKDQTPDQKKEEQPLPSHYQNEKEAMFYRDDIDFLKFHKRTTSNVHDELQQLIDSSKQTVYTGIKQNYKVTLHYVRLNRACSVVNAWWQINRMDRIQQSERAQAIEATVRKDEIEKYKDKMVKLAMEQDKDVKAEEVLEALDKKDPIQLLGMVDREKDKMIEAEIQKRLTKAVPYFRGKLCQNLGLRYAPEIRFYKDNSLEIFGAFRDQAYQYLEEANQEKKKQSGIPEDLVQFQQKVRTLKKMDPYQRQMVLMNAKTMKEKQLLETMMEDEQLQDAEQQVADLIEKKKAENLKMINSTNQESKPTRRDKRAQRDYEKLKAKINEAGQTNFDELSTKVMEPGQIDESIMGMMADVRPTKIDINEQTSKKYHIDSQSGEKTRLRRDDQKQNLRSKSERKKERSQAFWDRL